MYKLIIKRVFDIVGAVLLLTLLMPIMVPLTLVLAISLGGNPFFTQKRPGKNEKIFSVLKLKSMNNKTDASGNLLPDDLRITPLGALLRKTSLDEIPQLLNVIKGDMSFIGPRPLLIKYLPYYSEVEKLRHSVRPGITGLAQISGRNFLDWDKKFELDVTYVKNLSFLLDLKIFLSTIKKVVMSSDIAVATNKVTEDFDHYRRRILNDQAE